MVTISAAIRQMVKNGWTIANRRNIVSQIGKTNFDEIILNAKKLNITGDIYEFNYTRDYLTPEKITNTKKILSEKIKLLTSRWENPIGNYRVEVAPNSQVPMHHYLNGYNSDIRGVFQYLKLEKPNNRQLEMIKRKLPEIQLIDKSFSKLPPLEKDCIVYRGRIEQYFKSLNTDFDIISNAKIGDKIVPDTGYSYCAIDKSLAYNWGSTYLNDLKTIMYTIRLPKGAKVSRNLEHGGEVVMPRGAEYKVISKNVDGNHTEITLEYLFPKKDNLEKINNLMEKYSLEKLPPDYIKNFD